MPERTQTSTAFDAIWVVSLHPNNWDARTKFSLALLLVEVIWLSRLTKHKWGVFDRCDMGVDHQLLST